MFMVGSSVSRSYRGSFICLLQIFWTTLSKLGLVSSLIAIYTTSQASQYLQVRELCQTLNEEFPRDAYSHTL